VRIGQILICSNRSETQEVFIARGKQISLKGCKIVDTSRVRARAGRREGS
jgi:hypothetical protein